MGCYVTAADHADIFHVIFVQPEWMQGGSFFREQLTGHFYGTQLYGPAPDRAEKAAFLSHQHPGPGLPWCGTAAVCQCDENQIIFVLRFV